MTQYTTRRSWGRAAGQQTWSSRDAQLQYTTRRSWGRAAGALAATAAAVVAIVAHRRATQADRRQYRVGVAGNGMEYAVLGDGERTILFIPGGPGSEISTGMLGRLHSATFAAYLNAGYAVWQVSRRRNMPSGHTVADMADDHAQFVRDELGGHVDVVIGESYGGMIAQYLAANHPGLADRVVLVVSAGRGTPWGKDVDARMALARADGRFNDAGAAFLEYLVPHDNHAALRRLLGPLVGWMLARASTPPADLRVEIEAESGFDPHPVLGRIEAPVLMLCGDKDRFFSTDDVRHTALLIPNCTLVWYPGMGHVRAASSTRVPRDVLNWLKALDAKARERDSGSPDHPNRS